MTNVLTKTVLGRTGLEISRVIYGGIISMNEEQKDSDYYVDYAIDHGINYFDIAPSYGNAQEILGRSLKNKRNNVYLACKTGEFSRENGSKQFYESLDMLYTDHFDVFQLHGLSSMEQVEIAFSANGIMEFLVKAKDEGKIRNIGFSAHNESVAFKALSMYDFDTVLFPFNWSMNISLNAGNELLQEAANRNMGILALKVLAERALTENESDKYPKSWYKPIDLTETEFIRAAVDFSFSLGIHSMIPPGYFSYLKFMINDKAIRYGNDPSSSSADYLKQRLNPIEKEILPHIR